MVNNTWIRRINRGFKENGEMFEMNNNRLFTVRYFSVR